MSTGREGRRRLSCTYRLDCIHFENAMLVEFVLLRKGQLRATSKDLQIKLEGEPAQVPPKAKLAKLFVPTLASADNTARPFRRDPPFDAGPRKLRTSTSPKICPGNLQQPTLNQHDQSLLTTTTTTPAPSHRQPPPRNHQAKWVVFTPTEREFQPRLSPTAAAPPRGSRPPPTRSSTRSASWPRRVPPLPRSVSSCVTPTESPRSRSSPVCCCAIPT